MARAMGLDLGTKTIGVALSDPLYMFAQAKTTIIRKGFQEDLSALQEIIDREDVKEIVVGLPNYMDNSTSPSAQRSRSFVDELKKHFDNPIYLEDERLSTVSAESVLRQTGVRREKRKDHVDAIAATYILQTWLDRRGSYDLPDH